MNIIDCKTVGELNDLIESNRSEDSSIELISPDTYRRMWFSENKGTDGELHVIMYVDENDTDDVKMSTHRIIDCPNGWDTHITVTPDPMGGRMYYTIAIEGAASVYVLLARVEWNIEL